jgi:DNA polymerase III alpha subunit
MGSCTSALRERWRLRAKIIPDWLAHSLEIAERCNFAASVRQAPVPGVRAAGRFNAARVSSQRLVLTGLRAATARAPGSINAQDRAGVEHHHRDVGYEEYFLVVWSILQDCRARASKWITRGSAADSLVCYCLGISDVCPIRFGLYFRRFLNEERMALNKLPDIDIDFPHDRKDDVVDLIFEKYGREHCAVVGGFSTFQARSAFADVAKVLGMAEREVRKFTAPFPVELWGRLGAG